MCVEDEARCLALVVSRLKHKGNPFLIHSVFAVTDARHLSNRASLSRNDDDEYMMLYVSSIEAATSLCPI